MVAVGGEEGRKAGATTADVGEADPAVKEADPVVAGQGWRRRFGSGWGSWPGEHLVVVVTARAGRRDEWGRCEIRPWGVEGAVGRDRREKEVAAHAGKR